MIAPNTASGDDGPQRLDFSAATRLKPRAGLHSDVAAWENEQRQRSILLATAKLAGQLGARYGPGLATLERFEVYDPPRQEPVLRRMQEFAASIGHQGRGLVLFGPVGTGKDHLLAALLYRAVAAGLSCLWQSGMDLYGSFRDRMGEAPEEESLRRLCSPDVLGLSDPTPPANELTAWRLELLYRIIDRRYRALKATWITLNARDTAQAESKLGSQVWDRLQEGAMVVPCFWPSYRERNRSQPPRH
jgi:DNA replication protein DnaC